MPTMSVKDRDNLRALEKEVQNLLKKNGPKDHFYRSKLKDLQEVYITKKSTIEAIDKAAKDKLVNEKKQKSNDQKNKPK